ncbi:MAG: murein DD-endopeptidase MepM/ murein hydrolase activator NlpD [Candidatus Aldehydirespiratoraceae bacterium]|jgi:murein DD-endopeptidase MepM/ murein hydrolase activator NlpD
MTDQTPHSDTPSFDVGATISRRRLLLGGGAGLSIVALARMGSGSAGAKGGALNAPGKALEPAVRHAVTTTTRTTVPPPTTVNPLASGEILFPLIVGADDTCMLTDNFDAPRGCCRSHEGTDIMADHLLPVRAVANCRITTRYDDSGLNYGAGNGWKMVDDENNITYKFFHLDHLADGLSEGDEVQIGQVIGAVGNTGTSGSSNNTNYHLHFEYRPNNIPQNSYNLLQRDPNVNFA